MNVMHDSHDPTRGDMPLFASFLPQAQVSLLTHGKCVCHVACGWRVTGKSSQKAAAGVLCRFTASGRLIPA
jgi:hypothetical protein